MEFQTRYNYAQYDGEAMVSISKTEQAGYIPPKVQIEQMILAGKRLAQARLEQFDEYGGKGSLELDPTRSPGFDLADASALKRQVSEKLQNVQNLKGDEKAVETAQPETAETDSGK